MAETLITTGKPGLLSIRRIWLCVVAEIIAAWGILASIFLPLVQEQPGPPQEVETFAERYRLMAPDPPRQGEHLRNRLARRVRRVPSFDSFEYTETSVSWGEYDIPAPLADRSCSTTACYNGSSTREREPKINPVGRARSSSDPTGATSRAARRCMSFAADVAAKSTAPARPIVKRACSAIQRTLTFAGGDEEDGDCGLGVGARTKAAVQVATARTKKAINRTTTVATSAIMTASLKIVPGAKAEVQVETDEVTQITANIEKLGEHSLETNPVLKPALQPVAHQPLRNVFSQKWTSFKKTRIFSRRRVVAVTE